MSAGAIAEIENLQSRLNKNIVLLEERKKRLESLIQDQMQVTSELELLLKDRYINKTTEEAIELEYERIKREIVTFSI